MQLDQSHLRIRPRQYIDILDLVLVVLRKHWLAITLCSAVGVVPAILLNSWILSAVEPNFRFPIYLLALILEAPFVTALLTLLLGQITFDKRVSRTRLLRDAWGSLGQLLLFQFLTRAALLLAFVFPALFIPLRRKFANEIILLERNTASKAGKRIGLFHTAHSERVTSSALINLVVGTICFVLLCSGLSSIVEMLKYQPDYEWETYGFVDEMEYFWAMFPIFEWQGQLAAWATIVYLTIARFLLYLDCRIRAEGWDVELKLRAASERIKQDAW